LLLKLLPLLVTGAVKKTAIVSVEIAVAVTVVLAIAKIKIVISW
jgi:hypothetical protein